MLDALVQSDAHGLPYSWVEGTKERLESLRIDEVRRVAREYLDPRSFTWVLTGDLAQFEKQLVKRGIGSVEVWGADGKRIR